MDVDYDYRLGSWAHTYNGYSRLASDHRALGEVLRPVREAFERDGTIPDWAGVDLLRGWAFILVRAHRHGGGYRPLREEFPEFAAIVAAIERHPGATEEDRPPPWPR
ncbi:hypothetical protein [Mycolicibacterium palauense]|uniref:hypothetical protein n=1 Tax=Mycolicibacterium palauense TaxID=2034511 RepID=UPI001FE69563|nr:hypothetical protein [Mycolicibacterium palauense]